jgi:hypothetical protein
VLQPHQFPVALVVPAVEVLVKAARAGPARVVDDRQLCTVTAPPPVAIPPPPRWSEDARLAVLPVIVTRSSVVVVIVDTELE